VSDDTAELYTITLRVCGADPRRLAEAIQKRFADVVLAFDISGPYIVPKPFSIGTEEDR
jgi:hypothetical protein